jgi:hypothetical protein
MDSSVVGSRWLHFAVDQVDLDQGEREVDEANGAVDEPQLGRSAG